MTKNIKITITISEAQFKRIIEGDNTFKDNAIILAKIFREADKLN